VHATIARRVRGFRTVALGRVDAQPWLNVMSAATASDLRSGIGARLKAGRERMGLTLLQVAEKLHVDPKVLESLEVDRFEDLGAPVYVRGHIKRYSELVSENGPELLGQYGAM